MFVGDRSSHRQRRLRPAEDKRRKGRKRVGSGDGGWGWRRSGRLEQFLHIEGTSSWWVGIARGSHLYENGKEPANSCYCLCLTERDLEDFAVDPELCAVCASTAMY
ncbi:hypothetical protein Salat_2017600 [Sesamum alatum]|uniref:Uncharacterized protein n=1 Tax=Sesamum alatum TaxID=300844 RepID=A0AAE1XYX5_9LAMI|nr:hypothetical protein Salat_2017600 [Sesamum alatum]